jgi:hypothetical protein
VGVLETPTHRNLCECVVEQDLEQADDDRYLKWGFGGAI